MYIVRDFVQHIDEFVPHTTALWRMGISTRFYSYSFSATTRSGSPHDASHLTSINIFPHVSA